MRITSRTRRLHEMKAQLLAIAPQCCCCDASLTAGTACLAADHLFCSTCVNKVRQRAFRVQLQIISAMMQAKKRSAVTA